MGWVERCMSAIAKKSGNAIAKESGIKQLEEELGLTTDWGN